MNGFWDQRYFVSPVDVCGWFLLDKQRKRTRVDNVAVLRPLKQLREP